MTGDLRMEPKVGEIITIKGVKYITQLDSAGCSGCAFRDSHCWNIVCNPASRKDQQSVIFKKVETNMKEVKIQIPDNCELIKDGDTYIVKEKKQIPLRSWEEFCKRYPIKKGEAYIDTTGTIISADIDLSGREYRNWCTSKEEAEAFFALIQLRQLRKAWVGDWRPMVNTAYVAITATLFDEIITWEFLNTSKPLSFPTVEMAEDFLNCFRDLCETAKILL